MYSVGYRFCCLCFPFIKAGVTAMTAEIIDAANELTERRLELTIEAMRIDRNAVSATHCIECDEAIPQARRDAVPGCRTCASCQKEIELKNKQRWS